MNPPLSDYLPKLPPKAITYEVWDRGYAEKAPAARPGFHYARCYQSPAGSNYYHFVYEKDQEQTS